MITISRVDAFFFRMKTREEHETDHGLLPLPLGKLSLTSSRTNVKLSKNPFLTITHITSKKFNRSDVPIVPVTLVLAGLCFSIDIVAGWQFGYKYRHLANLPRFWVDHLHFQTGIIHLHAFATHVCIMHAGFTMSFLPAPVVFLELRMFVAIRVFLYILNPDQV